MFGTASVVITKAGTRNNRGMAAGRNDLSDQEIWKQLVEYVTDQDAEIGEVMRDHWLVAQRAEVIAEVRENIDVDAQPDEYDILQVAGAIVERVKG